MNTYRPSLWLLALALGVALPALAISALHITGNIAYNRALENWVAYGGKLKLEEHLGPPVPNAENAVVAWERMWPLLGERNDLYWTNNLSKGHSDILDRHQLHEVDSDLIPPTLAEMEEVIQTYAPALRQMRMVAQMPHSRVLPERLANMATPWFFVRTGMKLLAMEAEVRARHGDWAGAEESLATGFALNRHLLKRPGIIECLIWIAATEILTSEMDRIYRDHEAPPTLAGDLPRPGEIETALIHAWRVEGTNVVSDPLPVEEQRYGWDHTGLVGGELYYDEFMRGLPHHTRAFVLSYIQRDLKRRYPLVQGASPPTSNYLTEIPLFALPIIPQTLKVDTKAKCAELRIELARTALELREIRRRYGAYPADYPMPLDPFGEPGASVIYQTDGNSFAIVGADEPICGMDPTPHWSWN